MVRVNDKGEQSFSLGNQLFIERVLGAGDHQLLDQGGQPLGKDDIRRFGVLVVVVMKQLEDEGKFVEGVLFRARMVGGGFALLDALVQGAQFLPFLGHHVRVLLEELFKVRAKGEHDLLRFRTRD